MRPYVRVCVCVSEGSNQWLTIYQLVYTNLSIIVIAWFALRSILSQFSTSLFPYTQSFDLIHSAWWVSLCRLRSYCSGNDSLITHSRHITNSTNFLVQKKYDVDDHFSFAKRTCTAIKVISINSQASKACIQNTQLRSHTHFTNKYRHTKSKMECKKA